MRSSQTEQNVPRVREDSFARQRALGADFGLAPRGLPAQDALQGKYLDWLELIIAQIAAKGYLGACN